MNPLPPFLHFRGKASNGSFFRWWSLHRFSFHVSGAGIFVPWAWFLKWLPVTVDGSGGIVHGVPGLERLKYRGKNRNEGYTFCWVGGFCFLHDSFWLGAEPWHGIVLLRSRPCVKQDLSRITHDHLFPPIDPVPSMAGRLFIQAFRHLLSPSFG